jgi:hypothetical protein
MPSMSPAAVPGMAGVAIVMPRVISHVNGCDPPEGETELTVLTVLVILLAIQW